jgi:DNA-binding TFAR19-related protein (PDSD5 family)
MRRRTARDLTALADGTLPQECWEALLRRVLVSPELARALEQQLIAVEAIRRLDTPAPTELRDRIRRAIHEARATQPWGCARQPRSGSSRRRGGGRA